MKVCGCRRGIFAALSMGIPAVFCDNNPCNTVNVANEKKKTKVCVLGAGIAGLSSSVYLAEAGYDVICVESNSEEAQESSFMNGALLCPSLTTPWANTSTIKYVLSQGLLNSGQSFKSTIIDWKALLKDPTFWVWGYHFTKSSLISKNVSDGYSASYQLSLYSRECMDQLSTVDQQFEYSDGIAIASLQLHGNSDRRVKQVAIASEIVTGLESLDQKDIFRIEPALFSAPPTAVGLGGGIRSGRDASGDILQYCRALRTRAGALGVTFHMNTKVLSLTNCRGGAQSGECSVCDKQSDNGNRHIQFITVSDGSKEEDKTSHSRRIHADAFVVATGNSANDIAMLAGDGRFSWPMKGYVLDVPIDKSSSPDKQIIRHLIADDTEKVYISPLTASKVRISGIVDIGGPRDITSITMGANSEDGEKTSLSDRTRALELLHKANNVLPSGYLVSANSPDIRMRVCYRPQTPDDLPVIGPSCNISNLYYNAGHGHLGFTRATGSSRLLVDLMNHRLRKDHPDDNTNIYIPQLPDAAHLAPIHARVFSPSRFSFPYPPWIK